jgi:hypothetical protein
MTDAEPATVSVGHLDATAGDVAGLADWLTRLINDVYAGAERGGSGAMGRPGPRRPSSPG